MQTNSPDTSPKKVAAKIEKESDFNLRVLPLLFPSSFIYTPSPRSTNKPLYYVMVVKIRLARFGKRNAPFYNIVVAQARLGPLSTL